MYHSKCKKISLTHLCFADDLLIFSKGNLSSILGIQNVLNVFYAMSGLQLNCTKSELFSSGVDRGNLDEIQHVTGFKTGSLPVRYLGVPLVTRRLTDKDCRPLVERITSRINHWSAKLLSFAGRLQLVQTVLYTIQNYWCRQFLLPKSVLKKLNQLCSNFFWNGSTNAGKRARVSWKDICYPKAEGGLGLKNI